MSYSKYSTVHKQVLACAHTQALGVCNLVLIQFINPLIIILYPVLNLVNRHIFQNKDGLAESPPDASYV